MSLSGPDSAIVGTALSGMPPHEHPWSVSGSYARPDIQLTWVTDSSGGVTTHYSGHMINATEMRLGVVGAPGDSVVYRMGDP
jgi:hypothetical protein